MSRAYAPGLLREAVDTYLSMMDADVVATLGAALSDATRLRVLELADGRTCIGEIAQQLTISTATASYHVGRLADVGLVELVHRGRRTLPQRIDDGWRLLARELG